MDSDPKSVNTTDQLKKKQDDNQSKDLKLKQKVEDLDDQPKNLKMKQKVQDLDCQPKDLKMKQKVEDLRSSYPQYQMKKPLAKANLEVINVANVEGFQARSRGRRERNNSGAESSKRSRTSKSPEVIDLSSDSPREPLEELVEEIVRIYSDYIDHIFQMAKDRLKDEQRWNFDPAMCVGLAETFLQKIVRMGSELERMKKDLNQNQNYAIIEPRVRQIMHQLVKMHERFECSPNISASSKTNCTQKELILCINEIDQCKRELYAITVRIGELKTMKMHQRKMEIRQRNLRI